MAFAETLKKARKEKGLTQAELARAVNVSQPMIAQYETAVRVPSAPTALAIAKVLGTTFEKLLEG
ncbi:helix-turn-helix transcriptional regulator [Ruminococcus sp.]|jgi:transcriptional regulator with XRE-family HTH domain